MGDDPQSLINSRLGDECDAIVAVFGARLGTATPRALSGTVEEIERFLASGKEAMVYFSEGDIPRKHLNVEQIAQLGAFKSSLRTRGILGSFNTPEDFRAKLNAHLVKLGYDFAATVQQQQGSQSKRATASGSVSIRPLLIETEEVILRAAAGVAIRSGSPAMNTRDLGQDDEMPALSDEELRNAFDVLKRRRFVQVQADQGEHGLMFVLTDDGFERALPHVVADFDQVTASIEAAICELAPTTAEAIGQQLGLPPYLVERVAMLLATQSLVVVRRFSDETRIVDPSPELCRNQAHPLISTGRDDVPPVDSVTAPVDRKLVKLEAGAQEQFRQQATEVLAESTDPFAGRRYDAYYSHLIYPARFELDRFTLDDLERAAKAGDIEFRRTRFLLGGKDGSAVEATNDGLQMDWSLPSERSISHDRHISWTLKESGLLVQRNLMWEAAAYPDPRIVDARSLVSQIGTALAALVAVYGALGVSNEEVTWEFRIDGAQGREVVALGGYAIHPGARSKSTCISYKRTLSIEGWRTELVECGTKAGRAIFRKFNSDIAEGTIGEWLQRLYAKELT